MTASKRRRSAEGGSGRGSKTMLAASWQSGGNTALAEEKRGGSGNIKRSQLNIINSGKRHQLSTSMAVVPLLGAVGAMTNDEGEEIKAS